MLEEPQPGWGSSVDDRIEDIQMRLIFLETCALDKLDAVLTVNQSFITVLLKHIAGEEASFDQHRAELQEVVKIATSGRGCRYAPPPPCPNRRLGFFMLGFMAASAINGALIYLLR